MLFEGLLHVHSLSALGVSSKNFQAPGSWDGFGQLGKVSQLLLCLCHPQTPTLGLFLVLKKLV